LSNLTMTSALGVLGATQFGTARQDLQSVAVLQDGSPRLI